MPSYLRELNHTVDRKAFCVFSYRDSLLQIYLFRLIGFFSDPRPEFKLRPKVVDLYFKQQKVKFWTRQVIVDIFKLFPTLF